MRAEAFLSFINDAVTVLVAVPTLLKVSQILNTNPS